MIKVFDNFLTKDLIFLTKGLCSSNLHEYKWRTNLSWNESIKKSSSTVLILSLTDEKNLKDFLTKKFNFLFPQTKDCQISILYYIWSNLSFIPFLFDANKILSATIYLNENWNIDFGGLFLYEYLNEKKFVIPEFNKCVVNESLVYHGTSLTTSDAPLRETIQIFFNK
jgi:hypothetical protein